MTGLRIERFHFDGASELDWERRHALYRAAQQEMQSAPMPLQAYRASYGPGRKGVRRRSWLARQGDEVVAKLDLATDPAVEGVAIVALHVAASVRRRGIGRQLVTRALEATTPRPREIFASTMLADGRHVCEHYGGRVSLVGAERSLHMDAVDWKQIDSIRSAGLERWPAVHLVEFEQLPEALAQAYLQTYNQAWRDQPRPFPQPEPDITLEDRRRQEERLRAQGLEWFTLLSLEADGQVSAVTEIYHDPGVADLIRQQITGVARERRGRGLATWLKAELLYRLRARYPLAARVVAHNGNDNAPMLAINRKFGFDTAVEHYTYCFEAAPLLARLRLAAPDLP
ncbi:MAG: GNAT family N-acetyltransferase [Myxococcales bacterium]|nr:GNAT family N-acetyltransferase [Myxococcales bacterium]